MFWSDQLADKLAGPQTINDSKTPSGRAHVGALRGPLIHDAMFRTLQSRGLAARFLFGADDYDPLDELPAGRGEYFEKYLGMPLCQVPPPPDSQATDMADHYISEFFEVFNELGIRPEIYRMRDIYRSGKFNEAIDVILRHADTVRRIYKEISNADRPPAWHPFQVLCENCGRIGTTEVTGYDGKEVTYRCRPDLVKWARGCGHSGKMSPFNGNGKLPWKLEWVAKWKSFPVTIEGAGQDHNTKGGSRDVAAHCLRAIFAQEPPLNIPYEFFLVEGAKMSSSKGIGVSAREMADFLPPEILRFLMIRTRPAHHVNFSPSETHILKLFNEFDRFQHRCFHDPKVSEDDKRVYELSQVTFEGDFFQPDFQLVVTLLQMPHLDLGQELVKRKGAPLTALEEKHLNQRIRAARYWLQNYASEEEKTRLQEMLPARAQELTQTQRAFLQVLSRTLPDTPWKDEAIQVAIFNVARLTPIAQPAAFQAIYRVLLDRESGPKAGNLLSFLDRDFVVRRCGELSVEKLAFWEETGLGSEDLEKWLTGEKAKLKSISARAEAQAGLGVIEFLAELSDGKIHCRRVFAKLVKALDDAAQQGLDEFGRAATAYVGEVSRRVGMPIRMG